MLVEKCVIKKIKINKIVRILLTILMFILFLLLCVFITRFSTNVLKARHVGFTPHAKGGRKGPNIENRRVGDLNLEIPVDKPRI